ncbi:MAG: sodium/solute symporter [Planctomycetota bacterium]
MKLVNLTSLDLVVLLAYIVMLVVIGAIVSYRRRKEDDQFLGGRSFGWFNIGLSILGTNISPAFLIGFTGAAYTSGMAIANFEWLAWLLLMLLAMVFTPHYLKMRIGTMPQFVHKRFGEKPFAFMSFYTLLSTLIIWLGGALYAGGTLLSQIMDWPLLTSVLALIILATCLTVAGGLAVVIVTDTYQSILILFGTGLLSWLAVSEAGGIGTILKTLPAEQWVLLRSGPATNGNIPWYAILLGYPVLGISFWCTDQTIVQRVLGARDLRQGQLGAQFAGFLKILTPFVFILPGLACLLLHPELGPENADKVFMTMVGNYMPAGMVGLIIAVLVAALISTIDSGLNSFSTVYTLDIHKRWVKPGATPHELKITGQIVTVVVAAVATGIALLMETTGKNLFDLLTSLIGYFAPPIAACFLVGILYKRATAKAALVALYGGTALSMGVVILDFFKKQIGEMLSINIKLPHYLLLSFYLFAFISIVMIIVSLLTKHSPDEQELCTLKEARSEISKGASRGIWIGWAVLGVMMTAIYLLFNMMPVLLEK